MSRATRRWSSLSIGTSGGLDIEQEGPGRADLVGKHELVELLGQVADIDVATQVVEAPLAQHHLVDAAPIHRVDQVVHAPRRPVEVGGQTHTTVDGRPVELLKACWQSERALPSCGGAHGRVQSPA
jgi:hypothetical protein